MTAQSDAGPVPGHGSSTSPRSVESMPPEVTSIQPGGGFCMACELAWGARGGGICTGSDPGMWISCVKAGRAVSGTYPHEILDPRDLKFYRNQGDIAWRDEDDPFAWRGRLGVARVGWAEIVLLGGTLLILTALALWLFWPMAFIPLVLAVFVVYFFRNPRRVVPTRPGVVVSPADGQVFSIREVDHDEFLGGPAVVMDIFLSVFNVHLNRVPMECRVIGLTYRRGKFLNALRAEAARENESLELRLETTAGTVRALRVRQIAGAIARRIVCWVRPGEHLPSGGQFGMIKLRLTHRTHDTAGGGTGGLCAGRAESAGGNDHHGPVHGRRSAPTGTRRPGRLLRVCPPVLQAARDSRGKHRFNQCTTKKNAAARFATSRFRLCRRPVRWPTGYAGWPRSRW